MPLGLAITRWPWSLQSSGLPWPGWCGAGSAPSLQRPLSLWCRPSPWRLSDPRVASRHLSLPIRFQSRGRRRDAVTHGKRRRDIEALPPCDAILDTTSRQACPPETNTPDQRRLHAPRRRRLPRGQPRRATKRSRHPRHLHPPRHPPRPRRLRHDVPMFACHLLDRCHDYLARQRSPPTSRCNSSMTATTSHSPRSAPSAEPRRSSAPSSRSDTNVCSTTSTAKTSVSASGESPPCARSPGCLARYRPSVRPPKPSPPEVPPLSQLTDHQRSYYEFRFGPPCATCGERFKVLDRRRRYCSTACAHRGERERTPAQCVARHRSQAR